MTDLAASTAITIRSDIDMPQTTVKPHIQWMKVSYNCTSCEYKATMNTDPAKVMFVDMIDPRFSDFYCMSCCIYCAWDYDSRVMNTSAYLQNRMVKRMVERYGSPSEWNETYKNLWFPEDAHGVVWKAYLGDHYADGTMMIVRMKVSPLHLPDAVVYIDSDVDSNDEEEVDRRIEEAFAETCHEIGRPDLLTAELASEYEGSDDDGDNYNAMNDEADIVLPPSTPPAMDPVSVCPHAPVKPKEERVVKVNPFTAGPARIVWYKDNSSTKQQENLNGDFINE